MTKEIRGRRRGRPALAPGEGRECQVSVRMTPAEHADLVAEATSAGHGNRLGRYVYERHSGRLPIRIPAVNQEAWGRLGRVAGGLTTMARAAVILQLPVLDRALLAEVRDELRAVRLALIGANAPGDDAEPRRTARRKAKTVSEPTEGEPT